QGYKAWLTSLELSARETQTLRVVLEPMSTATPNAEASLTISTTPAGLDALLDGQPLPQKTPTKTSVKPGAHTISVRQNGVEVWHQEFTAEASSDYEFMPSFTADKQRERAERAAAPAPAKVEQAVTIEPAASVPAVAEPQAPPAEPRPMQPAIEKPQPVPAPPAPPPAEAPSAPIVVPPQRVQKLTGTTPNIEAFKNSDVPAMINAKLCIDTSGKVLEVTVLTKLDRQASSELSDALKTWTYAPYTQAGTAVNACFVVSLRVK
ncbi:MAG TPA: PEGA domain-containing protein, partial [Kofleriaceae bacterium]|nr:PEGA domain-containing protein [Kofleriaceae bacterium]